MKKKKKKKTSENGDNAKRKRTLKRNYNFDILGEKRNVASVKIKRTGHNEKTKIKRT